MKFLDQVYFDNSFAAILWFALQSFLAVLLLKRIISKYVTSLLLKLVKKNPTNLIKTRFYSLIVAPVERILLVLITIFLQLTRSISRTQLTFYHS